MNRIQRSRVKGSKLPPNTLCVTRPGKWGNPFKGKHNEKLVYHFREWINRDLAIQRRLRKEFIDFCRAAEIENIACWCSLDKPCHADVWIEIWNSQCTS